MNKILLLILATLCTNAAAAQGIIVDPDYRISDVRLHSSDVSISISDNVAHVVVNHSFYNPRRSAAEGIFLFPIPRNASVADFRMDVAGQQISGEVLEAGEARSIYERIVRKNLDPALLEWVDEQSFRARIFPIPARSTQEITLEYDVVVEQIGNRFRLAHPIMQAPVSKEADRHVTPPTHRRKTIPFWKRGHRHDLLNLTVNIESDSPLRSIYSPSHEVDVDRNKRGATVELEASIDKDSQRFILYYVVDSDEIAASVLPFRPYSHRPGYFLLMLSPPANNDEARIQSKEIVFVLDTSGSMAGEKLVQAKDALRYALNSLGAADKFGLISFSSYVDSFSSKLKTTQSVDDALYFVDQLRATGGTNINGALLSAIDMVDGTDDASIVFLTDGIPSTGVTNINKIIDNATDAASSNIRVFSFGVGYDVNTQLLDELSRTSGAFSNYVTPEENIEEVVSTFYDRVRFPVLTNLKLDFGMDGVHALAPRRLPNLFAGDPLIVSGRYRESGTANITLTGMRDGKTEKFTYKLDLPEKNRTDDFVARIWATRRVGQLLEELRRNGETAEVKDEVIELATEFGIVTPYTSYLIQEDEESFAGAPVRRDRDVVRGAMSSLASERKVGREAVASSKAVNYMQQSDRPVDMTDGRQVEDQHFVEDEDGVWNTQASVDNRDAIEIQFASKAYFQLLALYPETNRFLRLGNKVSFAYRGQLVQITDAGLDDVSEAQFRKWFGS